MTTERDTLGPETIAGRLAAFPVLLAALEAEQCHHEHKRPDSFFVGVPCYEAAYCKAFCSRCAAIAKALGIES